MGFLCLVILCGMNMYFDLQSGGDSNGSFLDGGDHSRKTSAGTS